MGLFYNNSKSSQASTGQKRTGPKKIKELQEEALQMLPAEKLYLCLFVQDDPPRLNRFHWSLFYYEGDSRGMKYHITDVNNVWMAEHGPSGNVYKSFLLCVIIEIGTISIKDKTRLDQIIKTWDNSLNDIVGIRCRLWTMMAVEALAKAGLVTCQDINAFMEECLDIGNQHMSSAANNDQPRPLVRASRCY